MVLVVNGFLQEGRQTRLERERTVEKWLGDRLRKNGFLYFKFVSPQNPGMPDRLIICPDGEVVFAELKTEVGRLSRQQQVCIDDLRRHGQRVAVVKGMDEARYFAQQMIQIHTEGGGELGEV
jgi:hypothetical protein